MPVGCAYILSSSFKRCPSMAATTAGEFPAGSV